MSEWTQYKDEQKERRLERLPIRQDEIQSLSEVGYDVKKLTDYQYRINGVFDLYPIHNRWHNLKTNKRGGAKNLKQFIIKKLKLN
jgi:hypothetical protein